MKSSSVILISAMLILSSFNVSKKLNSQSSQACHDPNDTRYRMGCSNGVNGCSLCFTAKIECLKQCIWCYIPICEARREEWRTNCRTTCPPYQPDPKPACLRNCENIKTSLPSRNTDIGLRCIKVYNDADYKGKVREYCNWVNKLKGTDFCNDCLSSVRLGEHVTLVRLHEH